MSKNNNGKQKKKRWAFIVAIVLFVFQALEYTGTILGGSYIPGGLAFITYNFVLIIGVVFLIIYVNANTKEDEQKEDKE